MKYLILLMVLFTGCVTTARFQKEQACVVNESSGFFLDSYIVTANHVARTDEVVIKTYDGREMSGLVVMRDKFNDICVIKYPDPRFWDYSIRTAVVGDRVYSISSPAELYFSFMEGKVQGLKRENRDGSERIQIGLDTFYGSSGAPVFDGNGKLVGMIAQFVHGTRFTFIVPANYIALLISKTKRNEDAKD